MTPLPTCLLAVLVGLVPSAARGAFFADRKVVMDVAEAPSVAPTNDGRIQVAPPRAGQLVDVEVFVPSGGTGAITSLALVFDNTSLQFTQNFSLEKVTGLVSAGAVTGSHVSATATAVRVLPPTGYVATVTLRARRDVPSGTELRLTSGTRIDDARAGGVDSLDVSSAVVVFSRGLPVGMALDLDTTPGYQARTQARVERGASALVEVYANGIQNSLGYILRFEFDSTRVSFEGFQPASLYPAMQVLEPRSSNGVVEISGASLGGAAPVDGGLLGRVLFSVSGDLDGEVSVTLAYAEFLRGGEFVRSGPVTVRMDTRRVDFDANGRTDFRDFLLFAQQFGRTMSDAGFDARFDLDRDGAVGFSDFVILAGAIGG